MSGRRTWLTPVVAVVVLAVLIGATFLLRPGSSSADAAADGPVISVSRSNCGVGWTDPHPGAQTFQVHNTSTDSAEIELIDPRNQTVYSELEGLGPGTTRSMNVTLGNGQYAFKCLVEETHALVGPTVTVTGGTNNAGPAVVPVATHDLLSSVHNYEAAVTRGLDTLVPQVNALRDAAGRGDRTATEAAWLVAHQQYERLGAAYDAFGDSDGAINGSDRGLSGGVTAEDFTGFHRIEYDLWHGAPMPAVATETGRLADDVAALRQQFPTQQVDPNDLGLRAHEILENALQFELTGQNDYGSGSTLDTTLSNVDGTVAVLDALRPVLAPRYPGLGQVDAWLDRVRRAIEATRTPAGTLPAVGTLPRPARVAVNTAVDGALERLAPVAAICTVRRTS